MIDVFDAVTLRSEPQLQEAMFRLRYRTFKERQGWEVQTVGGLEFDEFDSLRLNPIYFLNSDEEGEVRACLRLLPSTGPNMLKDVFSTVMDGDTVPVRPGLWEISRLAVEGETNALEGPSNFGRRAAQLFAALGEWGIPHGIDEVFGVHDVRIGQLLRWMGIRPLWMSNRHRFGNCMTVAASYEISKRELSTVHGFMGGTTEIVNRVRLRAKGVAA